MPRIAVPILVLCALPALPAQDTIELRDGTVLRDVKVEKWTAKEITFRGSGGTETRPAHEIATVKIKDVEEALRTAGQDAEALVAAARDGKEALVVQAAYRRAAAQFRQASADSDMIAALQELEAKQPDSAFAPDYYRAKIQHYLGRDKPAFADAIKVAADYVDAARSRGWSIAYEMDAEYWDRRIRAASGELDTDAFIRSMQEVKEKAGSGAAFVSQAATVDLADALRAKKQYKEARSEYEELRGQKGLDTDVRARMYLGLGYLSLEDAVGSGKKSDLHDAYKSFLMVYLNAEEAHPEYVAEGLYQAAKACEQWNELPSCPRQAGLLRGRLKYRAPWKDTSWAKKN